jgi:hypothetical protein
MQIALPNDLRNLCIEESRFKTMYQLMVSKVPNIGQVSIPPSAHVTRTLRRTGMSWVEKEKCDHCYSSSAPNAWKS